MNPATPYIIPFFIPHSGCPHQCVFCNQHAITGHTRSFPSIDQLESVIETYSNYSRFKPCNIQLAFFGGNFLAIGEHKIRPLLDKASQFIERDMINRIRFSTRPDSVNSDTLSLIEPYAVSTVEIGAQSMDDTVLRKSGRGHNVMDTENAIKRLKQAGYEVGVQIMVGLPGETEESAMATCRKISLLRPDFVRIYPTIVVRNSMLEKWFQKGIYHPLSLEDAVTRVKKMWVHFKSHDIHVIRMGLQVSDNLENAYIAGPFHPAFGHLVFSELFLDKTMSLLETLETIPDPIEIKVHPRMVSQLKGIRNRNITLLKNAFKIHEIVIVPDAALSNDQIIINQ